MTRSRRRREDIAAAWASAEPRACAHPACANEGRYPAPRSRDQLRPHIWLCLDHIRAYNAAWDYYAGMSAEEIEAAIRHDTVWQRPSWRLGARPAHVRTADPFEMFGDAQERPERGERWGLAPETVQALGLFGLQPPVTLIEIKARYKTLVKRHHPDAHGGDKAAEEKLKDINLAYAALVQVFGNAAPQDRPSHASPQDPA